MLSRMIDVWRQAYSGSKMVGWDFSRLDGRMTADEPWWDFEADCRSHMASARRIIDLGTGGGERLLSLLDGLDVSGKRIMATEGWQPNVPVAHDALSPMGIEVVSYDPERDERMPCADDGVDLVMSRHESIDARDVARALARGGRLLTQQVDGHDAEEIHEWFDEAFVYPHVTSGHYSSRRLRNRVMTNAIVYEAATMTARTPGKNIPTMIPPSAGPRPCPIDGRRAPSSPFAARSCSGGSTWGRYELYAG